MKTLQTLFVIISWEIIYLILNNIFGILDSSPVWRYYPAKTIRRVIKSHGSICTYMQDKHAAWLLVCIEKVDDLITDFRYNRVNK